jgi:beta-alanine--pyruvate transaminase
MVPKALDLNCSDPVQPDLRNTSLFSPSGKSLRARQLLSGNSYGEYRMKNNFTAVETMEGLDSQWLPFTPNRAFKQDPLVFERAEGNYYFSPTGEKLFDGSSGLFTTPAGHGRRKIADAVRDQLLRLDFTSSFLRSHPGSWAAATAIIKLLPPQLSHVFFVNSGSESVDTAVKIAQQYYRCRKQASRTIFVSRERAYHGSNLSGVALSGIASNRQEFGTPLLPVVHMRHTWLEANRYQPGQGKHGAELADDLLRLIQLHGAENIAACIVEPIAGSCGVLVPPMGYLERLREICDEFQVLLIFDEVICGFGRTGAPFAAQSFGVTPDIVTMAKAITNGVVPMGAVAVSSKIYDTIMEQAPAHRTELFHGYTASAHPVACAACIAAQEIYEAEGLFARAAQLSEGLMNSLFALIGAPGIVDVRGFGMLAGIEIDPAVLGGDGYAIQKTLFRRGLHLKVTGNNLIVAPPFTSGREDLQFIASRIAEICRTGLGNEI